MGLSENEYGNDDDESTTAEAIMAEQIVLVKKLNIHQVMIIKKLHSDFVGRNQKTEKIVYENGEITASGNNPLAQRYTLELNKNGSGLIRSGEVTLETRGFSSMRESNEDREMHNALDLFMNLCIKIPGFKKMSTVEPVKRLQLKPVLKAAVAPISYTGNEPSFDFRGSSLLETHDLKPSTLCNALALGATGSGKTVSCVLPLLQALLRYEIDGRKTSILVIDPKAELLDHVKSPLKAAGQIDRLIVLGKCKPIDLFNDNDGLDMPSRFEKIKALCIPIPADGDGARWQQFADDLLKSLLRDDQLFVDYTNLPLLENVAAFIFDKKSLLTQGPWVALNYILKFGMNGTAQLRLIADIYDMLMLFAGLYKLGDRPINRYISSRDNDQFFYNARGALTIVGLVGSKEVNALMNMSVRMGSKPGLTTDIAEAVENGKVIVFQPRANATFDMVGRALKSLFYRSVMERRDMTRPTAYVCDEAQRFISSDTDSGDQTFLDRCRAFRCNVVLATQSIAALQTVISPSGRNSAIIDGILVNCTTKIIFRTPDISTVEMLKAFIPPNPISGMHILTARPPASLKTGEYFYSVQEKFGRTQYQLPKK